jgi:hypothetical protein
MSVLTKEQTGETSVKSLLDAQGRYSHLTVGCLSCQQEGRYRGAHGNREGAIPRQRFWTDGLYCFVSDGRMASRLDEGRTPVIYGGECQSMYPSISLPQSGSHPLQADPFPPLPAAQPRVPAHRSNQLS